MLLEEGVSVAQSPHDIAVSPRASLGFGRLPTRPPSSPVRMMGGAAARRLPGESQLVRSKTLAFHPSSLIAVAMAA